MASTEDETDPITFEDLGIKPREATKETIFGKSRTWDDLQKEEILFLIVSFISLVGTIAMTSYIMHEAFMSTTAGKDQDFTLALLLLLNTIICIYYVIHGVMRERPYEIIIFMVACIIVIMYVVINFVTTDGWNNNVKLARLIAICLLVPVNFFLGSIIALKYHQSGNLIFRSVGANVELQEACRTLYFSEGLLKLDFQLEISLVILILRKGYVTSTLATTVLAVGIIFSIGTLILGYIAMRLEKKYLTWIFWMLSPAEPAYVIYRVVRAGEDVNDPNTKDALSEIVFAFAAVALVIRLLLVTWTVRVYRQFGRGLRNRLFPTDFPALHIGNINAKYSATIDGSE